MKTINEYNALKPAGHYSLATIHNDMVYLSGQLPIHAETGEKVLGSIRQQVSTVLNNIELILEEAGSSKDKVLKVSLYIPDMNLWDEVNEVYSEFFGDHKPARVVVPTRELHYGFSIEVDVIAYI
jgi:reactive intermediate/imine deaminase